MKAKLIPTLVLTIIAMVICGLLAVTYNATYEDTTGKMTTKLQAACEEIFGESEYEILINTADDGTITPIQYGNVKNIIMDKTNGNILFEVIANGYSKKGIDVVVGIDKDGNVAGMQFVSFKDMPGISKKKRQPYLDSFINVSNSDDVDLVDGVTAATYSSNGIKTAVKEAIDTYTQHKEEFFGE